MNDDLIAQAREVVAGKQAVPNVACCPKWAEALLAEHDARVRAERDFYERDLPAMQRLSMWLDPDPNLPLPNLDRLVDAAIARAEQAERERDEAVMVLHAAQVGRAAEARVATLEAALRSLDALMAAPVYASREALDQWRSLIVAALGGQDKENTDE